ncbi:FHA domain-containing protein [Actinoplanes sp. NPDC049265]|uniref:FHA domain-containing protein n=1 Tax=Actinoplanes sp. NPDC049265 TaxID=3363902 RepID=UPI0037115881
MSCPRGHDSAADDFCDVCGARMTSRVPEPVGPAAAPCPHCGTPLPDDGRFCENCGYDSNTGRVPVLSPAVTPATSAWTLTITADRSWFDANAVDGVVFPGDVLVRDVRLEPPQVRIGRKSASKGTDPEIDLDDPGVSHSHAILTQNLDGVWLVADVGSTNGTYVNEAPLETGRGHPLSDGDRVHVGAWTCITLHRS